MASGARPDGLVIVISSEPVVVSPGGCCSRRRCTGASLGYRCGWLPCAGQSGQCGIPDSTATSTKGQGRRARHYTCLPTRSSVPSRGHASELMTYDGSFEIVVHLGESHNRLCLPHTPPNHMGQPSYRWDIEGVVGEEEEGKVVSSATRASSLLFAVYLPPLSLL